MGRAVGAEAGTRDLDPARWFGSDVVFEESKLRLPPTHGDPVVRSRLLARLEEAGDVPVLAVAAPPGYGKTSLLRQWSTRAEAPVAWLSVGEEDNDPAVLLAYLATALARASPIDAARFRRRMPPGTPVPVIVAQRVAAALSSTGPVVLVIDGAEELHNDQCRDAVAELAFRLPPTARLAVGSRGTPPLHASRLRARGAVTEVGPDDLAMDPTEARALLAGSGVALPDDELAELVRHTEGWPVALHLAALAHRRQGRLRTPAAPFTGDDRLMADYLRTELLSHVPRGRSAFMIRTSVLDRLSGPLCDAVLGTRRAGRLLQELATDHLVVPLDNRGAWFRHHRLFRDLLRAELAQREPDLEPVLHARAARWCEANGLPEAAIGHAQAAGDVDRVARLVAGRALVAYADGRLGTVDRWFRWLDERGALATHPPAAVLGAVLMALMAQPATAERWAALAEQAPAATTMPDGTPIAGWLALMRGLQCRGGLAQVRRDAGLARVLLPPGSPWCVSAAVAEATSWLLDAEPERADALLAYAVAVGRDVGVGPATAVALAERAIVAIARDDWDDAERLAGRALAAVHDDHVGDHGWAALVHAVVARTVAHRGDVGRARASLAEGTRLRPQLTHAVAFLSVQTLLQLARACLALADAAGARAVLRDADDVLRLRPQLGSLRREADELRATVDTLQVGALGASSLTTAELRLIPLLSTHLSFAEIGERLFVSRHTVKTQAISVYRKLGVSSRSEAVDRAQELGLLGR